MTLSELTTYPVVRYRTPEDDYIDIMDRIGEMFRNDDLEYEAIENEGIPIRVATIETLIKLKKDSLRNIDKADVILLTALVEEKK